MLKTIASFFGLGYLPAGGTAASVVSLAAYFFLRDNPFLYNQLALFFPALALALSGRAERAFGRKDDRRIVLDEVAGMFVGFMFIPFDWGLAIIGFVLFRVFDIAKVYPLKRIEKLPGAWGIVLDDLCAGLYVNIILRILSAYLLF